jgi:pimeloyl-ACP methyl ester carboxylesterase
MTSKRKIYLLAAAALIVALAAPPLALNRETLTLDDTTRAGLPGQFIRLANGVTHYELSGPDNGPLVVLVHGFSAPYFTWDHTVEALRAAGFRVLRFDLYGRGFSDRPTLRYDLDLYVRQIDQLLDALEVHEPVRLVGLSLGGLIAADYANQYPQRVASLILADPQTERVTAGSIFPLAVPGLGEYLMAAYIGPLRLPNSQAGDFYQPECFPEYATQYRQALAYKGFKRAMLSSLRSLVGVDPLEAYTVYARSGRPALLLWGEEDRTVRAADIQRVRAALPEATFRAIPQAGHLSPYERPELVNPALVDFLETGRTP